MQEHQVIALSIYASCQQSQRFIEPQHVHEPECVVDAVDSHIEQAAQTARLQPIDASRLELKHFATVCETVSRRMEDLARELNCLGYFDDDDTPRAA